MASLFSWLNGPIAPKHIPTDTITPLYSRDDTFQNRSISVEFTMRFDSALDAQKLADALWKLLDRPGWRKLGARLRLNEGIGKLEYHIPAQYTKERPPINYTNVRYGMKISEHEVGAQVPVARDTEELQVFDVVGNLRGLMQTKDSCEVLADWIYTDKAQLGLHIVNFEDATLVTITWLHTLLDAMGRQALLRAWTAVLEGRDGDVEEFWGYRFDPLERLGAPKGGDGRRDGTVEELGKTEGEKDIPVLSTFSRIWTLLTRLLNPTSAISYLRGLIFTLPIPYGARVLCMPPAYLTRLRTEALRDLSSLSPTQITYNTSTHTPFLSDGDILCAWLTRLIITSNTTLLSSPQRPLAIINVLGMRDVLSTSSGSYDILIPKDKAYIGNCTTGVVSPMAMGELVDMPLGHVAARLRRDLVAQSSREAVEAGQRAQKQTRDNTRDGKEELNERSPSVFVFTNWAKAKLFETDFSAAIVGGREGRGRGRPSYIHVHGTDRRGVKGTGIGNCVGRDGKGNYWIGAVVPRECVRGFEKAVSGLQ